MLGVGYSSPHAGRQLSSAFGAKTPRSSISLRLDSFTSDVAHWSKGISFSCAIAAVRGLVWKRFGIFFWWEGGILLRQIAAKIWALDGDARAKSQTLAWSGGVELRRWEREKIGMAARDEARKTKGRFDHNGSQMTAWLISFLGRFLGFEPKSSFFYKVFNDMSHESLICVLRDINGFCLSKRCAYWMFDFIKIPLK